MEFLKFLAVLLILLGIGTVISLLKSLYKQNELMIEIMMEIEELQKHK